MNHDAELDEALNECEEIDAIQGWHHQEELIQRRFRAHRKLRQLVMIPYLHLTRPNYEKRLKKALKTERSLF